MFSVIIGDLPVYYERVFLKRLSIEAGIGVLLPYYVQEGFGLIEDEKDIIEPDIGYSLWLHPKYYFTDKAPEYGYMGFQYRLRNYNLKSGDKIKYKDLTLNFGWHLFLGKVFLMEYNIGVGFRFKIFLDKYDIEIEKKSNIAFPIGFRFGYVF